MLLTQQGSNSLQILILSQYFWPENFRINDVARDLRDLGHTVEVLTGKPNYPEGTFYQGYSGLKKSKELWQGIQVYRLPIFARGQNNKFKLALNYLSFILSGLLLAPFILRNKQYDVIFVYAPSPIFQVIPASFIGWLKKTPVVLWVQDLWPQSASATGHIQSPVILKILGKAVAFAYRHTDLLLAQSHAFIPHILQLNHPDVPVKYLPNSVDDSFLKAADAPVTSSFAYPNGFNVVFAGNIGSAQSISTIVDAAKKLSMQPAIKFIIIGQGSQLEWLKREISRRRLDNIVLGGQRPIEEMPHILGQASALLVTLAKQPIFALTIPSKVQAYLAVGKPIIGCLDGEGARILQEAGAGVTVPAEDVDALVNAVFQLYETNREELEMMGKNGQKYYKMHFKHDLVMSMLINHLEYAIDLHKGRKV